MFTQLNMWVGAAAGAALTAIVAYGYNALVDNPLVVRETKAKIEVQARERAMELIEKASKDHAEISSMDVRGVCLELGGEWLPDSRRCD